MLLCSCLCSAPSHPAPTVPARCLFHLYGCSFLANPLLLPPSLLPTPKSPLQVPHLLSCQTAFLSTYATGGPLDLRFPSSGYHLPFSQRSCSPCTTTPSIGFTVLGLDIRFVNMYLARVASSPIDSFSRSPTQVALLVLPHLLDEQTPYSQSPGLVSRLSGCILYLVFVLFIFLPFPSGFFRFSISLIFIFVSPFLSLTTRPPVAPSFLLLPPSLLHSTSLHLPSYFPTPPFLSTSRTLLVFFFSSSSPSHLHLPSPTFLLTGLLRRVSLPSLFGLVCAYPIARTSKSRICRLPPTYSPPSLPLVDLYNLILNLGPLL